jgi:hypothetical protein
VTSRRRRRSWPAPMGNEDHGRTTPRAT